MVFDFAFSSRLEAHALRLRRTNVQGNRAAGLRGCRLSAVSHQSGTVNDEPDLDFSPTDSRWLKADSPCILALALALLGTGLNAARADVALNGINVTYHGGALIQHVKVVPLLYGSSWAGKTTPAYLMGFLQTFFTDGRYLANLAQYSAGGYQIGKGTAVNPLVDPAVLPKVDSEHTATGIRYQVTDDQIQTEIKAQYSAGKLPPPDADTLYMVCVSPDVVVVAGGGDSENNFAAYHDYASDGGYAYAVIAPTGDSTSQAASTPSGYPGTLFNLDLTTGISHEIAEAVTDPQSDGWYDDSQNPLNGAEIADLADLLNAIGLITDEQLYPLLTGADGTRYAVEAVWSNQGKTLAAFAALPSP
jgi:hypothetical protein